MTASKSADTPTPSPPTPVEGDGIDPAVNSPSTVDTDTVDTDTVDTDTVSTDTVELEPNFVLPTGLAAIALLLLGWKLWVGLIVALFATFLMVQAATLRLIFTPTALDIYRDDTLIRTFPYKDWENWDIFWGYTPILFFFREVKSIHFLPILFDPVMLRNCLEARQLPTRRSWD